MIKFFTRCFALVLLLAMGASHSYGQTPFYSEDFANGIPAGWTNVDATSLAAQAVIFQHSTDPAAVAVAALGYTPTRLSAQLLLPMVTSGPIQTAALRAHLQKIIRLVSQRPLSTVPAKTLYICAYNL